jgi:hypothetical protein
MPDNDGLNVEGSVLADAVTAADAFATGIDDVIAKVVAAIETAKLDAIAELETSVPQTLVDKVYTEDGEPIIEEEPLTILEMKQIAHEEAMKGVSHVQNDILRLNNEIAGVRKSIEPLSGLLGIVQTLLNQMPTHNTADSPAITRRMKEYTMD